MAAPQTETTQLEASYRKIKSRTIAVICLYAPAVIALGQSSLKATTLPERVLSLAMLLFCVELARMARVDLDNIALIQPRLKDSQAEYSLLKTFRLTLLSTLVLELLGFYGTWVSLQWGGAIVLFSQLWFNLLAGIQLWPKQAEAIEVFGPRQRIPVLVANAMGLILLSLWTVETARLELAAGLLALVSLFLLIKYIGATIQPSSTQPAQTIDETIVSEKN